MECLQLLGYHQCCCTTCTKFSGRILSCSWCFCSFAIPKTLTAPGRSRVTSHEGVGLALAMAVVACTCESPGVALEPVPDRERLTSSKKPCPGKYHSSVAVLSLVPAVLVTIRQQTRDTSQYTVDNIYVCLNVRKRVSWWRQDKGVDTSFVPRNVCSDLISVPACIALNEASDPWLACALGLTVFWSS